MRGLGLVMRSGNLLCLQVSFQSSLTPEPLALALMSINLVTCLRVSQEYISLLVALFNQSCIHLSQGEQGDAALLVRMLQTILLHQSMALLH